MGLFYQNQGGVQRYDLPNPGRMKKHSCIKRCFFFPLTLIDPVVVEDREDPDPEVDRVDRVVHQTPRVVDREAHHILVADREAVDHQTLHPQVVEDLEVVVNHQTLGVGLEVHRNPAVVDLEVVDHRNWVGVDPEEEDPVVDRNPAVVDPEVVHRNWVVVDLEAHVGVLPCVLEVRVGVNPYPWVVRVGVVLPCVPEVPVGVVHPYPWEVRVGVVPPYPEHELHTRDPVVRADPVALWASWPWAADPGEGVHLGVPVPSWACHREHGAHHDPLRQSAHHSCTIP